MNRRNNIRQKSKFFLFIFSLIPFINALTDIYFFPVNLGANPIENLQDRAGNWGLRFILITLCISPGRELLNLIWISQFRRMIGLFAFFYVSLHFIIWLILDQELSLNAIIEDIYLRPFITIGFISLLILTLLAITSSTKVRVRLGKTWKILHKNIYVAAFLGVWHYWWQVRIDALEPLLYAIILTFLLILRIKPIRNKIRNKKKAH